MAGSNPYIGAAPGFALQDPSIQADQTALERQMQLAQLLRGQSLQGFGPTESFGGYAVRRSPLEGVAKIVQALLAKKLDSENDTSRGALAQKQGAAMQAMMAGLLGGGGEQAPFKTADPSMGPAEAGAPEPQMGQPGGPPTPAAALTAPGQADNPQVAQLKRAAVSAMLMGNQDLANKLIGNLMELTTEQKDMAAKGMDPRLMGILQTAAARKAGMMELQPGTTTVDLATGAERFQPKFGEGMQPAPGGGAGAVPGYAQGAAEISGAQAQAAEDAKLVPGGVRVGNETIQMTQGELRALRARAQQPPQGLAPPAKPGQVTAATSPIVDTGAVAEEQRRILMKELATEQAKPQTPQTQANIAGIQRELSRLPAAKPAPRIGVSNPVAEAGERATSEQMGKFYAKTYEDLQTSAMEASKSIARVDRLAGLLDGVKTGKLTPAGTELAAWAQAAGFDIDPKLGNKQASDALVKEMALQMRNPSGGAGMPGAMSDQDRAFLSKMTPSLANTPEGNRLMMETARKLAQRNQEVAGLARDYVQKHGALDNGFYAEMQAFSNANPLFATAAPAPAAGGGPIPTGAAKVRRFNPRTGMIE